MTEIPVIVTTEWLASHLNDRNIRVVDVSTYVRLPGHISGLFRAVPFQGADPQRSGATHADFTKQPPSDGTRGSFSLNGTVMRLTLHPGEGDEGHYRFWSGRETYEEAHIPGAVFADIHEFSDPEARLAYTIPSPEHFAKKAGPLGLGEPGSHVVIYDQGIGISFWASRLWWQLRLEGFENVSVLEGGFAKWHREGRPTVSGTETATPVNFDWKRREELLATKADVAQAIDDPNIVIVDSLSPADYRGEANSYGANGHIPSSVNIFCADHTDPVSNTFLQADALQKRFTKEGVLDPSKRVIAYCGGGLGATWNALVMHHLGKKDVAIYDGSMLEWAADPECRVEI